ELEGRVFFFSSRRRHTRLVSDWSSDVCSSDLNPNDQHWVVRSKSLMTRFPPGEKAVCMTPGGQALVRAVDRRSAPTAAMRERTSKPAAAQEFERSKKAVRVPR